MEMLEKSACIVHRNHVFALLIVTACARLVRGIRWLTRAALQGSRAFLDKL
jgi:hypothetical protein